MKTFVTDSLEIKRTYPDFIFANEIYNWSLHNSEDGYFHLKNKRILKERLPFDKIIGIVSLHNYRLIYDLLYIDKETKFYLPEDFKDRKELKIDKKKIQSIFEKYVKRSYLSFLNYEHLKRLGLRRIEQIVVLLGIISLKNIKIYDNLVISQDFVIDKIETGKKQIIEVKKINLLNFIYILNKELSFSFSEILSYLLRIRSELKITDPFDPEGFIFLEEDDSEVFKLYSQLINQKIEYQEYLIFSKDKKLLVKNVKNKSLVSDYLFLQSENYFEKKILSSEKEFPNILLLESMLKNIMPKKDFILTFHLLLKMKKIESKRMFLYVEEDYIKRLKVFKNKYWLNQKVWKDIYDNQDYMFGHIVEPISAKHIEFKCPLCGEENFQATPQRFFCGKRGCKFVFDRVNLKNFGIPKISVEQMIEALHNQSVLIKKKDGKNLPMFLNHNDNYFYLYIA